MSKDRTILFLAIQTLAELQETEAAEAVLAAMIRLDVLEATWRTKE